MNLIKKLLRTLLGRKYYDHLRYLIAHKKLGEFSAPSSFSEKVVARKLYPSSAFSGFVKGKADKLAVRDYVGSLVGDKYLPKLVAVDIQSGFNFEGFPDSFVVKSNTGSGSQFVRLVPNKNDVAQSELAAIIDRMFALRFGYESNEFWYLDIAPRIFAEEFLLGEGDAPPNDYKFFVFNGKVKLIQVDVDRFGEHSRAAYDREWKELPFTTKFNSGKGLPKPACLDEMISIAERLSGEIDFVRVDLYLARGERIVFGEMTFAPGAGWSKFSDPEWDNELGKYWEVA